MKPALRVADPRIKAYESIENLYTVYSHITV